MATDQQIAANRRNAKRSTGPRTPQGKARSSQNAFKTGLYAMGITIGHESAHALEELERQFTAEYHPVTATERSLVDSLIHLEWMLRRYRWLETEVWKSTQDHLTREQLECGWTGHAFISQPAIARIHRLRTSTQRVFHETLAELQAAQNKAPDPEIGFVPPEQPDPLPEPVDTAAAPEPQSPAPVEPSGLLTARRPGSLTCRRDGADRRSDRRQSAIRRFRRLPGACGAPQPGSVPIGFSYDRK